MGSKLPCALRAPTGAGLRIHGKFGFRGLQWCERREGRAYVEAAPNRLQPSRLQTARPALPSVSTARKRSPSGYSFLGSRIGPHAAREEHSATCPDRGRPAGVGSKRAFWTLSTAGARRRGSAVLYFRISITIRVIVPCPVSFRFSPILFLRRHHL